MRFSVNFGREFASKGTFVCFVFVILGSFIGHCGTFETPEFAEPLLNLTVAVGREAILGCVVKNLSPYKVAWLRVDTQTILTIHSHVITKNRRIGVTHSEQKTWYLHIKGLKESDRGWYMCQINTDPMKSQIGYLDVVVPPDIVDTTTSHDMIVDEGSNVTLRCTARGFPKPIITWKREDGHPITLGTGQSSTSGTNFHGTFLNITRVKREHMAPYLCIASNGVPPSVSKRIMLIVQFPPAIWIQYQLLGAYNGQEVLLECHSEAFPKSINYWTRENGEIIPTNTKFVPEIIENHYKVHMKLTIKHLQDNDYGLYRCISKNSLGEMEGNINIYKIPNANGDEHVQKVSQKSPNEIMDPLQKDQTGGLVFLENTYYQDSAASFSRSYYSSIVWIFHVLVLHIKLLSLEF